MLTINITPADYIDLIEKLDKKYSWQAADLVHVCLINRMSARNVDEYTVEVLGRYREQQEEKHLI